jgi:hypothetical protein
MVATLSQVCADHLLETKWLIAPSQRVGHQWVEAMVREGQAAVNLHPTTALRLALEWIGEDLTTEGLALVSDEEGPLLVQSAWAKLAGDSYLGRLHPTADLAANVFTSLSSLRMAECSAEEFDGCLESADKAEDIRCLWLEYEQLLAQHGLVDGADAMRRAVLRLTATASDNSSIILIPEGMTAVGLERRFLDALPAKQRLLIRHPTWREQDKRVWEARLSGSAQRDSEMALFRAIGEANEVREVLRRCLAEKTPLDDVEVLHTDAETYVGLIYELSRRYFLEVEFPEGIPITFAEGIPASASRPGRALMAWLQWIADGFPQLPLAEMVAEGLLDCGPMEGQSFSSLASLLRIVPIGQGAENYLAGIDERIALAETLPATGGTAAESERSEANRWARHLEELRALRQIVARVLEVSAPVAQQGGLALLEAASRFVSQVSRRVSELDHNASEALRQHLQERKTWLQRLQTSPDLRSWVAALPSRLRVLGSGPRPGHLHVAHVAAGGHSGRRHTFVIGLDDRRFPGAALQDPILLDTERVLLSGELTTSAQRLEERLQQLEVTLSRLPGRITLSWPCLDVADDRDTFPCSLVVRIYRSLSGNPNADLAALNAAAGLPASFAPSQAEKALDEAELWLWRLSEEDVRGTNQLLAIEGRYEHLARGNIACRERQLGFGPFNGYVPQAGIDRDPLAADALPLSPSALESAGKCPRRYFFGNVLQLKPPEELEFDPNRWLDAAEMGSLLHEVFRQFMAALAAEEKRPEFARDQQQLGAILEECIGRYRREVPPPNENAYRRQYWELIRTAKMFLQDEEQFCRTSQPRFFEVSLGTGRKSTGECSPLDSEVPIKIDLGDGKCLWAKGFIDRVDETGPHRFSVWDYKSGSDYSYSQANPFNEGRRVQGVMYLHMAQAALRQKLDPLATVDGFGYYFPGERTYGLRLHWTAAELDPGIPILKRLCALIGAGAFVATNNANDCNFCDFKSICGDPKQVASESQRLLADFAIDPLQRFKELRGG